QKRKTSLPGVGDRQILIHSANDSKARERLEGVSFREPDALDPSRYDDISQKDLNLVRRAVAGEIKKTLQLNPDVTEEALADELDERFGMNVSDLFSISINDFRNGRSEVFIKQVNP